MEPTREQLRLLDDALAHAFDHDSLARELYFGLGKQLDSLAGVGKNFSVQVFEVIQAAEQEGWSSELVRVAYKARPKNATLAKLHEDLELGAKVEASAAPATPASLVQAEADHNTIEEVVATATVAATPNDRGASVAVIDVGAWRLRLAVAERQVCVIEVDGARIATGFLVGPDLVLTCRYVLATVIDGDKDAGRIRCRFDYQSGQPGVAFRLRTGNWLVAESSAELLDYALVKIDLRSPEARPDRSIAPRGWIELSATSPATVPGSTIMLLHHAEAGPLTLSVESSGVIGAGVHDRLRYFVPTQPGSGGAPCFSSDWRLLAIHEMSLGGHEKLGVLASAIRGDLERKGLADLLSSPAAAAGPPSERPPKPPKIVNEDDAQQGRWGGRSEVAGRRLIASVRRLHPEYFVADFSVVSTDGSTLEGPVVFHLHDTYSPSVFWIRKVRANTKATLEEVESYGSFTAAAQVRDRMGNWVGLELDLRELPGLPTRFRRA